MNCWYFLLSTSILFCTSYFSVNIVSTETDSECVRSVCYINEDSLRFFFLGDFGGQNTTPYTTDIQWRVADTLNRMDYEIRSHFYLTNGDNIYKEGVQNVDDFRFKVTFEDVYNKPGHYRPWYLMAGNHDYNGNISAQIAYSSKSWRWNYPDYYYSFRYKIKSGALVEFVMMDSIILVGNINVTYDDTTLGPKDPKLAELHWRWIEDVLKSSNAHYLFLVGHYPIWSKGYHGPTPLLTPRMIDLTRRYNVTAYLAGHDHNLQHVIEENTGMPRINQIVNGMGCQADVRRHVIPDKDVQLRFIYPDNTTGTLPEADMHKGGFVVGNLTRSDCKFIYYDGDGVKLYEHSVTPRY